MTASASLVSSDARSTASTALRCSSSPSTDASQRRTLRTISSWVSPSKFRVGTGSGYCRPRGEQRQQLVQDAGCRAPHHVVAQLEEVDGAVGEHEVPSLLAEDALAQQVAEG